jgi:hypothetical protein
MMVGNILFQIKLCYECTCIFYSFLGAVCFMMDMARGREDKARARPMRSHKFFWLVRTTILDRSQRFSLEEKTRRFPQSKGRFTLTQLHLQRH